MTLQWLPFLWQAGGIEIDELQTKVTFNSAAGVAAMKLWIRLYEKQEFSRFGLAHDLAFSSGHVAMILDGPWNLPQYRQVKNFEWAVAPLPAGPVQKTTYIAGEQLAIFKQSKHPHEAWTFVKWLLEPRIQSMFSMASGYLPVRRAVLQRPEFQDHLRTDPALKAFVDQMRLGRARRPIDVHRVEINRFLAEAIESAVRGRMAPQEALDEAAAKANALLRSARERKRITTTK